MMFSFACLWSSLTHCFALSNEDCAKYVSKSSEYSQHLDTYSLCNIVDHNSTVCVSVVHRCERLVSLLPGSIPYLELYGGIIVERYRLGEEGGTDCGLSEIIELILYLSLDVARISAREITTNLDKPEHQRTLYKH